MLSAGLDDPAVPLSQPSLGIFRTATQSFTSLHSALSLRSTLSTELSLRSFQNVPGVLDISLLDLCDKIRHYHSLHRSTILSASTYVERRSLLAPHRFVVLCLHRTGKRDVWMRLDRKPTSRTDLAAGFGITPANDRVRSFT